MHGLVSLVRRKDHCRIGSLEMGLQHFIRQCNDHCRIGSLEKQTAGEIQRTEDHCRIGSLEKVTKTYDAAA